MDLTTYHSRAAARALAVALMASSLIACSGPPGSSSQAGGEVRSDQAAPAADITKPGQPLQVGDLTVILQPAELKHEVGLSVVTETAAEGGVLVVVRYSVVNHSAKPVSAALLPQIKLLDPQGVRYEPDAGKTGAYALAHKPDSKIFSDLNPGITVRNAEVFEVSKSSFDPKTWVAEIDGKKVALRSDDQ